MRIREAKQPSPPGFSSWYSLRQSWHWCSRSPRCLVLTGASLGCCCLDMVQWRGWGGGGGAKRAFKCTVGIVLLKNLISSPATHKVWCWGSGSLICSRAGQRPRRPGPAAVWEAPGEIRCTAHQYSLIHSLMRLKVKDSNDISPLYPGSQTSFMSNLPLNYVPEVSVLVKNNVWDGSSAATGSCTHLLTVITLKNSCCGFICPSLRR